MELDSIANSKYNTINIPFTFNITAFLNFSDAIHGSDFIAIVLTSDNMDPKKQLEKGISAVDLGNSSSEAIAFWFVLPPVTFTRGITVTVTSSDGGVFEKSTSNKLEIGRSAITKLGALEVIPEYVQPNSIM